jgi:hypothetical protein
MYFSLAGVAMRDSELETMAAVAGDFRLEEGRRILLHAMYKSFNGIHRQRGFQMSRSHRLVEFFGRGIIGAKTDVLFKKDLAATPSILPLS